MINFTKPINVTSPRDLVEIIEIIQEGDAHTYAIAKLKWNKKICYGIRWNASIRELERNKQNHIKQCKGVPSSRGYPTWFILPNEFNDFITSKYLNNDTN